MEPFTTVTTSVDTADTALRLYAKLKGKEGKDIKQREVRYWGLCLYEIERNLEEAKEFVEAVNEYKKEESNHDAPVNLPAYSFDLTSALLPEIAKVCMLRDRPNGC